MKILTLLSVTVQFPDLPSNLTEACRRETLGSKIMHWASRSLPMTNSPPFEDTS